MKKIAYLGIQGAYSEQAARQYFAERAEPLEDVSCGSTAQILDLLTSGAVDYGILPIENSLGGTVSQSYELLIAHHASIQGEVILHIDHALMALPGETLATLKQVRSHPQALAQCASFLKQHHYEPVSWYNTAGSARDLAAVPQPGVGAIASPIAAELYGLTILATGIQDIPHNYTRFFVLGNDDIPASQRNKTSLIFTTKHEPGALVKCLQCFADEGLNLNKIESRPQRDKLWEYVFYCDLEGHLDDVPFKQAMTRLADHAAMIRVLGAYPAAETPVIE